MIQKYLPPNRLLHSKQFAMMCDYSFMRTDFQPYTYIAPNKMEEITNGSTVYCWSSRINELFSFLIRDNIKDITLITGDNDHSCNPNGNVIGWPQYANMGLIPCPRNVKRWFAQNAEIENGLMTPFSIGVSKWLVDIDENEKEVALEVSIDQYKSFMVDVPRNSLLFFSGDSYTSNPLIRKTVENIASVTCPDITISPRITQRKYFEEIQKHLFVLCPPGNGKDTHRVWESLYFGAIPVVEDSAMYRHFAKYFPILTVETWFDVTPKFLLEKYKEMSSKTWRYDLLDAENYFDHYQIKRSTRTFEADKRSI